MVPAARSPDRGILLAAAPSIGRRRGCLGRTTVEHILPLHKARTYPRLSNRQIGVLMNFNSVMPKDGIRWIHI
jgi:hypothetical protein